MSGVSLAGVDHCTDLMMEALCTVKLPAVREAEEGVALIKVAAFILRSALVDCTDDGRSTANLVNADLADHGVEWRVYRRKSR